MRWQYSLPYEWNLFHNIAGVASGLYLQAIVRIVCARRVYRLHCWETNKCLKLTPWSRGFIEKLIVPQPVKTLTEFYATRRFVTVFTTARQLVPPLRNINQVHALPCYFLKIHFNIMLSNNLRASNYCQRRWNIHIAQRRWKIHTAQRQLHINRS